MSSAGHVFDMIRRLRANRALLHSKKEGFRDNIEIKEKRRTFLRFKKLPESDMKKLKQKIRKKAEAEKRKYWIVFVVVAIVITGGLFFLLS